MARSPGHGIYNYQWAKVVACGIFFNLGPWNKPNLQGYPWNSQARNLQLLLSWLDLCWLHHVGLCDSGRCGCPVIFVAMQVCNVRSWYFCDSGRLVVANETPPPHFANQEWKGCISQKIQALPNGSGLSHICPVWQVHGMLCNRLILSSMPSLHYAMMKGLFVVCLPQWRYSVIELAGMKNQYEMCVLIGEDSKLWLLFSWQVYHYSLKKTTHENWCTLRTASPSNIKVNVWTGGFLAEIIKSRKVFAVFAKTENWTWSASEHKSLP